MGFRRVLRCEGLDYAVGIHRTSTVWGLDSLGRRQGKPVADTQRVGESQLGS
jgi:SRSO17 transposase